MAKKRQQRAVQKTLRSVTQSVTPSSHQAILPLGALMLAASVSGWAQTAPAEVTLGTVTVQESAEIQNKDTLLPKTTTVGKGKQTIKEIPQSVTIFTEKLMQDRNQDDFREVLRSTAGVTFQAGETGEEDVRLRGFSLAQAGDIYSDGMKDAPLQERDTFNLDRVEVLKGSASMLFGKGSTGGIVNQVNKAPLLIDQHEVSYTFGTGKFNRATADLNFKTGDDSAFRLNAMVHDADNYGAKQKKQGVAPTFAWGIGTRDEFSIGAYYLNVEGRPLYNHPWIAGADGKIIPSLPAKNYYGLASDYLNTETKYVNLGHIHRFDNGGELNTRLRLGNYQRDLLASTIGFVGTRPTSLDQITGNTVLSRGSKGRVAESDILQVQSDYTNNFNWGGRKHAIIAGVDYFDEDAKRNASYANTTTRPNTTVGTPNDGAWVADGRAPVQLNTFKSRNLGVYLQDTMSLTNTLKLVGGLRFDSFNAKYRNATGALTSDRSDNLWSPRVGMIFEPNDYSAYYASYGTSYNTSGDTYQWGNLGTNTARAADTGPEKSRNFELGGKWDLFDKRALAGAAFFYTEKYNERNTDPDVAAQQELLSGKRHAMGMEFNLAGRISPKWEIFWNHTWIPSAEIDKSNVVLASNGGGAQVQGDRPALTPKHSGSIWSTYAVTPKFRVGGGLTYRSKQNPEGSRAMYASGFATIDAMAEYSFDEKTSLKLNVTNLANKLYADTLYRGFYAPGAYRTVQMTLKHRF